jgi:hypothetical protein
MAVPEELIDEYLDEGRKLAGVDSDKLKDMWRACGASGAKPNLPFAEKWSIESSATSKLSWICAT